MSSSFFRDLLSTITDQSGTQLDGNGDGTPGDPFRLTGSFDNRFYAIPGDFNGDFGVSIFDFSVFAYWFGLRVGISPEYVDLNFDGGVSIFDFPNFVAFFGQGVTFPSPVQMLGNLLIPVEAPDPMEVIADELVEVMVDDDRLLAAAPNLAALRRADPPRARTLARDSSDLPADPGLEEILDDLL